MATHRPVLAYAPTMLRAMTGFHRDDEGHWVAELCCGHQQHVRHKPPFELRPWVLTPEGRAERLGQSLDCVRCDRKELPEGFAPYKRTPTFTETTVPAGLLREHRTKPGVWARIVVEQGQLEFHEGSNPAPSRMLRAGEAALVSPELEHRVAPAGAVRFHVEFWRARPR